MMALERSYSGGGWGYSEGANPYNGSSRAENSAGAKYTFQSAVTGYQTVSLWWTYWSSRCTRCAGGYIRWQQSVGNGIRWINSSKIEQVAWNILGTYAFMERQGW